MHTNAPQLLPYSNSKPLSKDRRVPVRFDQSLGLFPSRAFHTYLPVYNNVCNSGFYVTGIGESTISPHAPYPPAQHPPLYRMKWEEGRILPDFSLLFITAGAGTFESTVTGPLPLNKGATVVLFPGVWHRYRPLSKVGWTELWMHFNGEFPRLLLQHQIISPERPVVESASFAEATVALRRLLGQIQRTPPSNSPGISLKGLSILAQVLGETPTLDDTEPMPLPEVDPDPLVSQAIKFIWNGDHSVLSVEGLANALKVNRRTLERRMRASRGHGILEEIIQCRFSRAQRLLHETNIPIKAVVGLAGFGTIENMRRVFLVRSALSPDAYRLKFRRKFDDKKHRSPV